MSMVLFERFKGNLVDRVREHYDAVPTIELQPTITLSDDMAGQSVDDKIAAVRTSMTEQGATVLPINRLDQIAWLFNVRGKDIAYNPVFLSNAIVTDESVTLYTDHSDVSVSSDQVDIKPYTAFLEDLGSISNKQVLIDKGHLTQGIKDVAARNNNIIDGVNPIPMLKVVKNKREMYGMTQANMKASVVYIKALKWLKEQIKSGDPVTEKSFSAKLDSFYRADATFVGNSFGTISGTGAHGAIIHYKKGPDSDTPLKEGELFLFDSGGHYIDEDNDWAGTTDITRTVFVGNDPSDKAKDFYTQVLKAHINGAMQIFPQGESGKSLDAIVRHEMHNEKLGYAHGTGHGIGAFLNVHEDPVRIRMNTTFTFDDENIITSIEPGFYETGWGGIRLENLYTTQRAGTNQSTRKQMMRFEPLNWIPFERELIDATQLTDAQLTWLNDYHQQVYMNFSTNQLLSQEELTWLETRCAPLVK